MLHPTAHVIAGLMAHEESTCVSIYISTHRRGPERRDDPKTFRHAVERVADALRAPRHREHGPAMLARLEKLAEDPKFFLPAAEGLAVLLAPHQLHVFRLARPVRNLAVCASSFHIKPLLRLVQTADRFHVLALSEREIALYEGNRWVLERIEPRGIALTVEAALGPEIQDPQRVVPANAVVGGREAPHAHGMKKDETAADVEHFFRTIDRQIARHLSQTTRLPLVLAGLPEAIATFRHVSKNPFIVESAIPVHPRGLDHERMHIDAFECVRRFAFERLRALKEDMKYARAHGLGSDDLFEVARAAVEGRVGTILVDEDREIFGEVTADTGAVNLGVEGDDVLDDLAEIVMRRHGEAIVCPTEEMPSPTGVFALYRY